MNSLANLLQSTHRYAEAESLYRQSLSLRKKAYGCRHPNVAMCMSNLAILMQATAREPEAEALFKRAMELLLLVFWRFCQVDRIVSTACDM